MIYLDHNATTRPSELVREAVDAALGEFWHNPSSVHRAGQAARHRVELARAAVADLIGAKAREITFTSGGTEALDLAIRGTLESRPGCLITTRIEHAAVRELASDLEKKDPARVRWCPLSSDATVDLGALERLLGEGASLLCVQWANNETGVVQPVDRIAELARAAGVPWCCDATQWIGKEPCPAPVADMMAFAPHKFHGPKGVGVLFARAGVRLKPRLLGSQELGRRAGTENVPGILGAGAAAAEAAQWLADPAPRERQRALRDRFETRLTSLVPDAVVNAAGSPRLWNTTNIGFPTLEAEALLLLLSERGLCASAGAACSSGSLEPSPVLLAMGIPPVVAHGSVRFSLGRDTTPEEVEQAAEVVAACVSVLRRSA
ncbi:MAG: cysteine desulfurase family protein [Phycisphaerales bacterium]